MREILRIQFSFHGYEITTDKHFQDRLYRITPELSELLEEVAIDCQTRKENRFVKKLITLINEYPHIPMFKNYLSVVYNRRGEKSKVREVEEQLFELHPDYLYSKLAKASEYLVAREFDKIPEILGKTLDLKDLYPDRKVFHFSELTNFLFFVIRYYAATDNLASAQRNMQLLEELAPENDLTLEARKYIFMLTIDRAKQIMEEEKSRSIIPVSKYFPAKTGKRNPPVFNHPQISGLYLTDFDIPRSLLEEILKLPHKTVVEDLISVLHDAIDRYHYYNNESKETDETETAFPLHAALLLAELRAEEALPEILHFLEFNDEFQDFWFGDIGLDSLWMVIFQLGKNQLGLLQAFLLKPGIDTFSKACITNALCQMVLHDSAIRPKVLDLYKTVFTTFANANLNDNLIDSDFLGYAIDSAISCSLSELLPDIKTLYDKNYVALSINGTYSQVEMSFKTHPENQGRQEVISMFEFYDKILENWDSVWNDIDEDEDEDELPMFFDNDSEWDDTDDSEPGSHFHSFIPSTTPMVSEKTGRNEPCPCGSGKKYKKCCMKED